MAMVFLREHSVHQQEVDVFHGVCWLAVDGLELHIKIAVSAPYWLHTFPRPRSKLHLPADPCGE